MEAVGIFLSPVIKVVIEKLLAPEIIKLTRQGDLHKAIHKLKTNLENINEVLDDAEERQLSDKAVNKWLKDLHYLAYDAEDLLDEFATEALRRKLQEEEEEEPDGSSSSKCQLRETGRPFSNVIKSIKFCNIPTLMNSVGGKGKGRQLWAISKVMV